MNGKIIQSELINRKNDLESKECIGFEYDLLVDDGNNQITFPFRFTRINSKVWQVELVIDYQVYKTNYEMPKSNCDLTLIAAFGLRNIQYQIEQEVQMKSIIDFTIGDATKEM